MNKYYFTLIFCLCVFSVNAQFFTPADKVVRDKLNKQTFLSTKETGYIWLFRPSISLTAVAIQFGEKTKVNTLNSVGTGVSYGKFSMVNGKSYCDFSVNAALLTKVNINGESSVHLGGALIADVFNKFCGIGCGYLDKKFMLLTSISYSF